MCASLSNELRNNVMEQRLISRRQTREKDGREGGRKTETKAKQRETMEFCKGIK